MWPSGAIAALHDFDYGGQKTRRRCALKATIHDVAAQAGVSARTVSRVINKSPKVGEATKIHIEAVMAKLGFQPNHQARALAFGRSFLIGVVQDDPNAHVLGIMHTGIVEAATAKGYELVVHPARFSDRDLLKSLTAFVERSRVDGLILLSPISEREDVVKGLKAKGVPNIILASVRPSDSALALVSDDRSAAYEMGRYLIGLGHRRIGFVAGPGKFQSSKERREGFTEALREAGIRVRKDLFVEGDYSFASGVKAGEALMAMDPRPTAVFASNDNMAVGVMKAAFLHGVAIPGQLSVAGFDDSDVASMVNPDLTTIRRPLLDLARAATEALIMEIAGKDIPPAKLEPVQLELVTRGTTGKAPADH